MPEGMSGLTPVLNVGNDGNCGWGNGLGALIGGAVGGAVGNAWNGNRWSLGNGEISGQHFIMDGVTATNANVGSASRDILAGIQGLQMANCQGFGGLNTEITRGQARTEAAVYTTGLQGQIEGKNDTIATLQASHNNEINTLKGFYDLRAAQDNCCCTTQRSIADESCKTRQAIHSEGEATRALISQLDRERLLRENAALSAEVGALKSQQFTAGAIAAAQQQNQAGMNQILQAIVGTATAARAGYLTPTAGAAA